MFLPIGDVNPCQKTPYVNYSLLAVNCAIFLLVGFGTQFEKVILAYGLIPEDFDLWNVFSSMFLHAGLAHLFGNMLFLWIVGDNVEDLLGHVGYVFFYLGCGVAAALAHVAGNPQSPIPCVGASGAIAGVLGAYVVLFPQSRIKVLIFLPLFLSRILLVPAVYAIGFWFLKELWQASSWGEKVTGVAYWAHVGGFAMGAALTVGLRAIGWVRVQPTVRRVPRYSDMFDREEEDWR